MPNLYIIKNSKKLKNKIGIILSLFILMFFFNFKQKNEEYKNISFFNLHSKKMKRIGVTSLRNDINVGNILVKFAMFNILDVLGLNCSIITPKRSKKEIDLSFLNRTINSHLINIINLSNLNEKDYDYLMVNSDQTWCFFNKKRFYDVALLEFAKNWKIKKFIYGASMRTYNWLIKNKNNQSLKKKFLNFDEISFREKETVNIFQKYYGLHSSLVLDPTLLIDKQYYLDSIINFEPEIKLNNKYIFVYQLDKNKFLEKIIKDASTKFNLIIYEFKLDKKDYIENFIYGISKSRCVITDSYHGTIFSIIFLKPFIAFSNKVRGKIRFDSLKEVFNLFNRIIEPSTYHKLDINLLIEPLTLNITELNIFLVYNL